MKKLVILLVIAGFLAVSCQKGPRPKVPEAVKKAFYQKFPNVKVEKWYKEGDNVWEAEFHQNGKEYEASFDSEGNWLETEYEIRFKDLPDAVKQVIKTQFKGYEREEIAIAETPYGKVYEVEFEKGKEEFEVEFKEDGTIVKKEPEQEEVRAEE